MLERSLSMVLRVTMLAKDLGKLEAKGSNLYDHEYTGNHIVIFECELKTPPSLAMIDNTYKEFLNYQRLSFSKWRIVDVDHYMHGNSFFSK